MQDHRIPVPLGIEGFRVTGCEEGDLGLEVHVETTAPAGLCPGQGAVYDLRRMERMVRQLA